MLRRKLFSIAHKSSSSPRFFHSSPIPCDAFHYMKHYHLQMPEELTVLIKKNHHFAIIVNNITQDFIHDAITLEDIRTLYTSPVLNKKLEDAAKKYSESRHENVNKLINIARLIRKFGARDKMIELNFESALNNIHTDNMKKYANPIAPTLSFLNKKYNNNEQAIAEAAIRFRSTDEVNRILNSDKWCAKR